MTTTLNDSLPSSAHELDPAWVDLLTALPGYDPFVHSDGYGFDSDAAGYAIGWIESRIKHVKGKQAGKPFILTRWEKSVVANLFGWKNQATGYRRFRECLIYVAKKNGKTTLVAAILLFVLCEDGEMGAELYSAAASREQAALIFAHANGMVRQEPKIANKLTVYGGKGGSVTKSIVYDDEMSSYKCLSADANTADGASVHFAAVDELHRHKTPELADVLQKSTAERAQPLVIHTSTADYNRPSLCNDKLKYAHQVMANTGDPSAVGYDPQFLPVVFECTKEDDWTDPEVWAKANPNLNETVPVEFLRRECQKAKETPSELNNFLRLHLNIVTDADEAWLVMDRWDSCSTAGDDPVEWRKRMMEKLAGMRCIAGLDLSSTNDLTALSLLFPDDGHVVLPWFWMPKDNAHKREREHKVPYSAWARQGFLTMTEGDYVDQSYVLHQMLELCEQFAVKEVAVDRHMARQITMETQKHGIDIVEFGQGFYSMSGPSKHLETLVMKGDLDHGGNPVLRWMAGNVMLRHDPAGNIKPDKAKSAEKIDGIVSLIMTIGRMLEADQGDEYITPMVG